MRTSYMGVMARSAWMKRALLRYMVQTGRDPFSTP